MLASDAAGTARGGARMDGAAVENSSVAAWEVIQGMPV